MTPFLFSQQTQDKPSSFELVFFVPDGEGHAVRYRYGFTIDADKVIEEHLFAVNKVRELMYFVRDGQDIEWNPSYFKEAAKLVREQKVRPNAALLSVCAQDNGKIASSIIKYFQQYRVLSGVSNYSAITHERIKDNADFDRIVQFLHFADIQIVDLKKQPTPNDSILFGHAVYEDGALVGKYYLKEDDESLGTNKLFSYAGIIFDALDAGSVLFVDEFDSSLHPLIVENIIKLFNSPVHNPRNAQLVVSCQSVHTMTNKMLRRDQIWFCEKDRYGATDLYSLYDFDEPVRKDATFNKMYLQGKYGAVPDIDDIRLKGEMRE